MNSLAVLALIVPALSLAPTDPCLAKCAAPLSSLAQRPEMRPLYPLLSDVTFDQAKVGMDEICRTLENQTKCMKACPKYDLKTAMTMHPALARCTKHGSETILTVLECQISTREQVQKTCSLEKLEEFAQLSAQLARLIDEARVNPLKAATSNFRNTFGDACGYASELTTCMVNIYQRSCSYQARDAILTSLSTLLGTTHATEGVSDIHEKCADMMAVFEEMEQAWTTVKTTARPTTTKVNKPASLVLGTGSGSSRFAPAFLAVFAAGLVLA